MPVNFFSVLLLFLFLGAIFLFLSTFIRLILETCRSSQKTCCEAATVLALQAQPTKEDAAAPGQTVVTFLLTQSGKKLQFPVASPDFSVADQGMLQFQGRRFLSFTPLSRPAQARS